jgi:hypothetical protein
MGENNSNPRKHFIEDLTRLILHQQDLGHEILLMLDANDTLETDTGIQSLLTRCNLNDIHRHQPATSTYIGSANRRIDFVFGSAKVDQNVTRSGTLQYNEGPQADLRGLYVYLMLPAIFDHTIPPLATSTKRLLHNGNPETVETYLNSVNNYYHEHNMVQRISQLFKNHKDMHRDEVRKALIKWDLDQGRAMISAELSLRTPTKPYQWSPQLRNAGILLRYWKLRLKEVQQNHNYSETFAKWQAKTQVADPTFLLPSLNEALSIEQIRTALNTANKTLRRTQRNSTSGNPYLQFINNYS